VTTTSGVIAASKRFRLRTFGTLRLVHSTDETVLGDHGHHRRRLALLAVLAASGEAGRSRDQLQGLFWPEVSQARARHSLEQLLYALRSSLDDDLFTGGNPVRLNAALIGSDVGDFSDALARRELESAIALYRGPFLDGFYLSGAPEFDQWMEAERGRAERAYTDALERLAKSFEDANNPLAVAPLLHKLIDIDPVSSKHAIGLIRALMNSGDHASALRYAERYEAIVERELGLGVGPDVAELVAEIRARGKADSIVVRGVPSRTAAEPDRESPAVELPVVPAAAAGDPAIGDPAIGDAAIGDAAIGEAEARAPRRGGRRRVAVRYGIAAIALAALAAVGFRVRARTTESARSMGAASRARASIAVLPLVNHSADPGDATLADDMTEQLIATLAKVSGLRVIASTSVFAPSIRGMDVRRIADTLGVAYVVEGDLQKTGSQLRVRVRLAARDASTLWSDTYDRDLRDVFAVEDDIAGSVVRQLNVRIGSAAVVPRHRQPTQSVAAYEVYRQASDKTLIRSDSGVQIAMKLYQQAIALDSTYAAAWAGLGSMYGLVATEGRMPLAADRERYHALAEAALQKAISLDDSLPAAHVTLGHIRLADGDLQSAEQEFTRAIAIDPGFAGAHEAFVSLSLWMGRPADELAHAQRAVELDPLASEAHAERARALLGNDRCDEALAELGKLSGVKPAPLRVVPIAAECYAREGRWSDAIAVLRPRAERGDTPPLALLGFMLGRSGQREQAQDVRATLLKGWQTGRVSAFWVAVATAGLGDREQTCEWFERSIADHSFHPGIGDAHQIVLSPPFADVRSQPCFDKIRKRLSFRLP
jgi:TolB-like protein/DNA-binding SARP family transcriptional activator